MNVFTVCPATPMLAAPNPRLSSGSVPEVKTFVKNGVEKTTATKLLSSGSPADVIENRPKKFMVELIKPGSDAGLATAGVLPTVSVTSPLVIGRGGGSTMVDAVLACSDSRRATASSNKSAGGCTGAVGGGLANGDRTASITVDTRRDTGSAGVGVITVDAGD